MQKNCTILNLRKTVKYNRDVTKINTHIIITTQTDSRVREITVEQKLSP